MKKFFRKIVVFILQWQAKVYLEKFKPKLILVCGQINRSNVKEEIIKELQLAGHEVRGNLKGYNSEIGVPLSVLNLEAGFSSIFKWLKLLGQGLKIILQNKSDQADILVLEVAFAKLDEIKSLFLFNPPKIIIFSDFGANISQEIVRHTEQLIKELIGEEGIFIFNEEEFNPDNLEKIKMKVYKFGVTDKADLQAYNIKKMTDGQEFNCRFNREEGGQVRLNKFGIQAVHASLIARFILSYFKNNVF